VDRLSTSEDNYLREGNFQKIRISQEQSHGRKGRTVCLMFLNVLVKEHESGILSLRFGYKAVKEIMTESSNVFTCCQ